MATSLEPKKSFTRCDSVKQDVFTYLNTDKHSSRVLKAIQNTWESKEFCDVELVVGIQQQVIPAHRIILVAFCEYFNGLLKPNMREGKQASIRCFDHLHSPAVFKLIQYGYTGTIHLNFPSDNIEIEQLLEAADYMGLSDVCAEIGSFLEKNLNDENCLGFLQCADHYNLIDLRKKAFNYASRNYGMVSETDEFYSLPEALLEELIMSEVLVIQRKNIVVSVDVQEEFVVDSLLKYVNHDSQNRHKTLERLLKRAKLPLLAKAKLQSLEKNKLVKNCKDCLGVIKNAKKTEALGLTDDSDDSLSWARPRRYQGLVFREQCEYAGGNQVTPEVSKFSCREILEAHTDTFIAGLKLGFRRWDGRLVLGGIQVKYSTGTRPEVYGMEPTTCEETHEVNLQHDERIVKADLSSGWMIDNMAFSTNLGNNFGAWGGPGGSNYSESAHASCGYLAGISGTVVKSQELLGITKLRLMWGSYDFNDDPSGADNKKMLSVDAPVTTYGRGGYTFTWDHNGMDPDDSGSDEEMSDEEYDDLS